MNNSFGQGTGCEAVENLASAENFSNDQICKTVSFASYRKTNNYSLLYNELCGGNDPLFRIIENMNQNYQYMKLSPFPKFGNGVFQFLAIEKDFQLVSMKGNLTRNILVTHFGIDGLNFCISLNGTAKFFWNNQIIGQLDPGTGLFLAYPKSGTNQDMLESGKLEILSIYIKRPALASLLGIGPEFFLPKFTERFVDDSFTKPLQQRQTIFPCGKAKLAREILDCEKPLAIRSLLLKGKVIQLISLFVADLGLERPSTNYAPSFTQQDLKNLAQAKEIIDNDMMKTFRLSDVARMVGLNRSKLSQAFHSRYGITIKDYSIFVKMSRAEEFIKKQKGTLSELSELLGYSHPNSLSEAMKNYFGFPPRELARVWGASLKRKKPEEDIWC